MQNGLFVSSRSKSFSLNDSHHVFLTREGRIEESGSLPLQALKVFEVPITCDAAIRRLSRTILGHLRQDEIAETIQYLISHRLVFPLPSRVDLDQRIRGPRDCFERRLIVPTGGRIHESIRLAESITASTNGADVDLALGVRFVCGRSAPDDFRNRVSAGGGDSTESFVTHRDRVQLARDVAADVGVDPEVAEFAYCGPEGIERDRGALRNTALSQAEGRPLFMIGDDLTLSGIVRTPECVRFRSRRFGTPVAPEYFPSRNAAIKEHTVAPIRWNYVERYAPGQSIQAMARACESGQYDYADCDADLADRVFRREARIDLTCFGTIGDSAMTQVQGTLFRPPFAISDPAADTDAYQVSRETREILRLPDGLVITDHPFLVSAACAFDTSHLLPPFFPVSRGTDTVYGTMLTSLFSDSLIAHAPVAFYHDPPEEGHDKRVFRSDVHVTAALIISLIIARIDIPDHICDRAERLRFAGQWLCSSTRVSLRAFSRWIEDIVLEFFCQRHWQLQQLLDAYDGEPEQWADDVRKLASTLEGRITDRRLLPIMDYGPDDQDPDTASEMFRNHLQLYGKLLVAWPDIMRVPTAS